MKRILLITLVIAALLVSVAGTVVAAPPTDNPGKGPPEFAKVVFIHYAKDFAPARPARGGSGSEEEGYIYSGRHWSDGKIPVDYLINLTGSGDDGTLGFSSGIQTAFQTWEDDPGSYMDFSYSGTTITGMSGVGADGYMDGHNVVGWADLSSLSEYGPRVIAVTVYWFRINNLQLAEVDVAMNTNGYSWSQNPAGEKWTSGNASGYDVDVQNIMTHEVGHWLVLNDLYADGNEEKTMYGEAPEFELKSRSLDSTDETGINVIYPSTGTPPTEGTMHVATINMWYETKGPNYWIYTEVTVRDADGAIVPEAAVDLTMTLPDNSTPSGSGVTKSNGTVTFKL